MTAALLKKETPSQTFFKVFAGRFSCQNYRTDILKKTFLIRTPPMTASAYPYNFVKNKRKERNTLYCVLT